MSSERERKGKGTEVYVKSLTFLESKSIMLTY